MSRFYVKPEQVKESRIYVDGPEAHHILDVMRLKKGDQTFIFDGTGKDYFGIIEETTRTSLVIKIEKMENKKNTKALNITLAQALPRKEKMDYIVEKATELGVCSIIPMKTERTVPRIVKEKEASKKARWERIAREACKQCGRSNIAKIEDYTDFKDVLKSISSYDITIMPSTNNIKKTSLKSILSGFKGKSILLFIGPEGGFSPKETALGQKNNIAFASLGANVLKSDTACIASIAIIKHTLE